MGETLLISITKLAGETKPQKVLDCLARCAKEHPFPGTNAPGSPAVSEPRTLDSIFALHGVTHFAHQLFQNVFQEDNSKHDSVLHHPR